jgi:hypothetical protein
MSYGNLKPEFTMHWFIFLRALAMRFEKAPVLIGVRRLEILQAYFAPLKITSFEKKRKMCLKNVRWLGCPLTTDFDTLGLKHTVLRVMVNTNRSVHTPTKRVKLLFLKLC